MYGDVVHEPTNIKEYERQAARRRHQKTLKEHKEW